VINYVLGDATRPQGEGPKFIIHCCNNFGLWGAGFVLALSRRWSAPEYGYRDWGGPYKLGQVQLVKVEDDLHVLNMIGQSGVRTQSGGPPIRYEAIRKCLKQVALMAKSEDFPCFGTPASIHAPRFGAGLAGGEWDRIAKIIQEELVDKGLSVTIYDFAG